jgi:hypothetical protein
MLDYRLHREDKMKVFISWSGELSNKIAQSLKKWIPCIVQSADVFYSPEDIEKGENWDSKLTAELECCNYGIVCLTKENTNAPWIHFEAGALAKKMDSRVTALLVDTKISDIKGPLSRFQATKLDKEDVYHLIKNINLITEQQIPENTLRTTFDAMWEIINKEITEILTQYSQVPEKSNKRASENSEILEEILNSVRKQSVMIENFGSRNNEVARNMNIDLMIRLINMFEMSDITENNDKIIHEIIKTIANYNEIHRISGDINRRCNKLLKRYRDNEMMNMLRNNQITKVDLSEKDYMELSDIIDLSDDSKN